MISSVASRLGVSKADLLDPTSSDAAVRQAHAETHVIQETKAFLEKHGVDLSAFEGREKDDRIILLKNFPFGTSSDELRNMLTEYGELSQFLIPPAGTIALAEFKTAPCGRLAFAGLAYRRFKDGILFLEKGPKNLFSGATTTTAPSEPPAGIAAPTSATDLKDAEADNSETSTLFVRNLNFTTTTDRLTSAFAPLAGFQWARVKTKSNTTKTPDKILSMGFGFVGFDTAEHANIALKAMDGQVLEGHKLLVKLAHNGEGDKGAAPKKEAKHKKIVVKNLPFEVTKKDITSLFGYYPPSFSYPLLILTRTGNTAPSAPSACQRSSGTKPAVSPSRNSLRQRKRRMRWPRSRIRICSAARWCWRMLQRTRVMRRRRLRG